MSYSDIKKKYLGGGNNSYYKTNEKRKSNASYSEIASKYGLSANIDQDYINSFISDANKYLSSAEEDYKSVGWSNASSAYDSRSATYSELRKKSSTINRWLIANRDSLDNDTYTNLRDTLRSIEDGTASVYKSFESAKDFYSQFETEEAANKYKKREEEEQAILNAEDFEANKAYISTQSDNWWDKLTSQYSLGYNDLVYEYINNQNGMRDEIKSKHRTYSRDNLSDDGESIYEEKGYDLLEENEIGIYNYYYATQGKEKADEYLKSIENKLAQRKAGKIVEAIDGTAIELLFSVRAGLDQFASGIKNIDNYIMGKEADPTSAIQYAQAQASSNNEGIWKVSNDLVNTTANMLPSILVSTVTGSVGGLATMGASAVGNSYAEMRNLGYEDWQAAGYATLVGASEVVLQSLFSGISKLGGKYSLNAATKKLVDGLDNAIARLAVKVPMNMASEGLEEAIQTAIEPAYKALVTGEDFEAAEWSEILYSGLLGSLSALGLEGAPTIAGTAISNINAKKAYGDPISQQNLIAEAVNLDGEAGKFADRYLDKLAKGKSLSGQELSNLASATMNENIKQDTSKIKNSALKALGDLGETSDVTKVADVITKAAKGETLTSSDYSVLNDSKAGYQALAEIDPYNIESGGLKNKWAEDIGTKVINPKVYNKNAYDTAKQTALMKAIEAASMPNSADEKENATERKFEVSESGKTIYKDADVNVEEIVSIEGENIKVKLDNGETVSASDLSFSTSEEAAMYEMIARMEISSDSANELLSIFKPTNSSESLQYMTNVPLAYKFGKINYEAGLEYIKLSEEQKRRAYNLGRIDASLETNSNTPSTNKGKSQNTKSTKKNGIIFEKGVTYDEATANDLQKASMAGIEVIDAISNLEVHVFESKEENGERVYYLNGKREVAPNGFFRDGNKIYIDLAAGDKGEGAMLYTMAHEVTHYIRKWNAKGFKELGDFLIEQCGKKGVPVNALIEDQIAKIKRRYEREKKTLPGEAKLYDMAYEEMVADAMSDMFADEKAFEKLVKLKQKNKSLWQKLGEAIKHLIDKLKATIGIYSQKGAPVPEEAMYVRDFAPDVYNKLQDLYLKAFVEADANYEAAEVSTDPESDETKYSYSSIAYSFFGDKDITIKDFENGSYTDTEGYKNYVNQCLNNMRQTSEDFDESSARKEVEDSIAGIVKVAVAMKKAGYDILDNHAKRNTVDSKNRLLFTSLEPNSDYFTSSDISTICDKRINFAEIYDEIVRREEALGVPKGKRFFDNVDNYFIIHKIMADKGLTQPCRQCYVESMRKNLAPMANAFLELMHETDPNNKANKQLYQSSGKNKGELKSNNAKLREKLLETITEEEYTITANDLTVEMLTTEEGLAQLRLQAPLIYEAFNSFYGQSKPKMPKSATPFRFGELTALLTDNKGNIKKSLIDKIMSTGGFRLQSYSDFQIQNFADVLQVIFEAGTLGLSGHAYTKVPAFLDATKGTNLKRNISIFMYKDGGEWKIDRNDSFPYDLDKIYDIVKSDKQGNTSIIAVSQNEMMSAFIMANDNIGYFIPFHKSGMKMGTVRETIVKEGGREIKGYSDIKDHTRQQTEVWAKTTADHKAYTKVKNGINIYEIWDFDNKDNLSKDELIKKNLKAYIDACEDAGYLPKFREYVMNNSKVLNAVLSYSKQLGFVSQNANLDDISFEYKGYRIPFGYYKCLGDFGMFTPSGVASSIERLSLKDYNFDEAVAFFSKAETVKRNEILQQIANGTERERYITGDKKNMTTAEIAEEVQAKRNKVVDEVVSGEYKDTQFSDRDTDAVSNRTLLANALESVAQNDIEKNKLEQYKEKIALIESEQAKLDKNREEAKSLRVKRGRTSEETRHLKQLDIDANVIKNRINVYDRQLLNLESTKALKGVLEREKATLRASLKREGREALKAQRAKNAETVREIKAQNAESRHKAVESRNKTELRGDIKKILKRLNKLFKGGKERNVKEGMKETVSTALALGEVLFNDYIGNRDIVKLGVESVTETESKNLNRYRDLLQKLEYNKERIKDIREGKIRSDSRPYISEMEAENRRYEAEISRLNGELSDVFERERSRLIKTPIHELVYKLALEYHSLSESEDEYIKKSYQPELFEYLVDLQKKIGNVAARDMSIAQLERVKKAFTMIEHSVRTVNQEFKDGKWQDIDQSATKIMDEVDTLKDLKDEGSTVMAAVRSFMWNELTPYYAFDKIGSKTLMTYYTALLRGQGVAARDWQESKSFAETTRKKYNYSKWKLDEVHEFKLADGRTFRTTLKHLLSVYAYSKREQAEAHMSEGGFFHNDKATFRRVKGVIKLVKTDSEGYKVDARVLAQIKDVLGAEKMSYVDEMLEYLTKMGEKGNEVTRVLWGVDIFTEKVYFPLKSKDDFLKKSTETATAVSLKNDGMTKETIPGANNPIVLEAFDDVWAKHVERMSIYHGTVIPIDNLNKVLHYGKWVDSKARTVSTMLKGKFTSAATDYLEQFINDLNGGTIVRGATNPFMRFFSKFKKTAVGASLSTIVQQPTAIIRAMAEIDAKYFVGKPSLVHFSEELKQLKTYAPIAIIKEIGGFDAGGGGSAARWINSDTLTGVDKVMNTIDDVSMKGAEYADWFGWLTIWDAVKRETKAMTDLAPDSTEFLEKCGERFEEVITKTQVYDSTLSRSGFMRSKNDAVKMLTAFMGEPTLSVNMMYSAVINALRGGKEAKLKAAKTIGFVYLATILAETLSSAIYALRDDDEDESYMEKYLQSLGGSVISDIVLAPVTSLPGVKDLVSIFQGWDVERSDMAIFKDIKDAFNGLDSDSKSGYRKVEDFAGAIAAAFGLPLKNVLRTGRELFNATNHVIDGVSGGDAWDAFSEGITGTESSKSKKLYDAIVSGDKTRIQSYRDDYKTESSYESAVRKALREYDPRIKEAAQARYEGRISEYTRIAKEIIREGSFSQDIVVGAINAELNAIRRGETIELEPTEDTDEVTSIYSGSDINSAFESGDTSLAKTIIDDIVNTKVANGMTEKEAKSSLRSSMTSYWKPLYKQAYNSGNASEMARIRKILYSSGLYGTANDVVKTTQNWQNN